MSYLDSFSTLKTPQSEPLPGQVPNSAGGHAFAVDDWVQFHRFLILGSEGGSYYAGERELTRENAKATMRCIEKDGIRAVREIVGISLSKRAPKNDPAIFALALAASTSSEVVRGLALDALPKVCRTGTHLFTFASYIENFRGWGRMLRNAVARWYRREDLPYQLIKYRQRYGWTHRDLLRLSHPEPTPLLAWAAGKPTGETLPELIYAFQTAQVSSSPQQTAWIIQKHPDLPREALNPDHLTSPLVWEALLEQGMPMTALIRNLATMTKVGLLTPTSDDTNLVVSQLSDAATLRRAGVHPLNVLVALKTYQGGQGIRGNATWTPVASIVDALDAAFYAAFGNVQPSRKRTMLALDVSSSMNWVTIAGMPGITPRIGSAAMSLVTAAVEPQHMFVAFAHGLSELTISPRQRLDNVIKTISGLGFGSTDCALPMLAATQNKLEIDQFVIYTDSETWAGAIHPVQALDEYRNKSGINAKLAVVGMVSNGFSIADPTDAGMLDVVGFDSATPSVLSNFATGDL